MKRKGCAFERKADRNRSPVRRRLRTPIHHLPEELLVKIFTILPTKMAVRTTLVCKRWNNLWHQVPILKFMSTDLVPDSVEDPLLRESIHRFIGNIILHRPFDHPLRCISLDLSSYYGSGLNVESIVDFAVKSNVTYLNLSIQTEIPPEQTDIPDDHHPPLLVGGQQANVFGNEEQFPDFNEGDSDDESVYSDFIKLSGNLHFEFHKIRNSRIEVLKLTGFDVSLPISELPLRLPRITHLSLSRFHSTTEDFDRIVSSCVGLYSLRILDGRGIHELHITCDTLRHFTLSDAIDRPMGKQSLCIEAPLLTLRLISVNAAHYELQTSELHTAKLWFPRRTWWDYSFWTNVARFLGGVQQLSTQNMLAWSLVEYRADTSQSLLGVPEGAWYDNYPYRGSRSLSELKPARDFFSNKFIFGRLYDLELLTGSSIDDYFGLVRLLRMCPKLRILKLDFEYTTDDEVVWATEVREVEGIPLKIPCLREVLVENCRGTRNQRCLVSLLMRHGVVLDRVSYV